MLDEAPGDVPISSSGLFIGFVFTLSGPFDFAAAAFAAAAFGTAAFGAAIVTAGFAGAPGGGGGVGG